MYGDFGIWFHLLPVAAMIIILCTNQAISRKRADRRRAEEALRLKAALCIELSDIHEVYRENLRLIARKSGYLISTRHFVVVYRGNLGRVALLDPAEAAAIITAFSHCEKIEGIVSANAKRVNGPAFLIETTSPALPELRRKYRRGQDKVVLAMAALGHTGPLPMPGPRRVEASVIALRTNPSGENDTRDAGEVSAA
jgi:hypothetical protein